MCFVIDHDQIQNIQWSRSSGDTLARTLPLWVDGSPCSWEMQKLVIHDFVTPLMIIAEELANVEEETKQTLGLTRDSFHLYMGWWIDSFLSVEWNWLCCVHSLSLSNSTVNERTLISYGFPVHFFVLRKLSQRRMQQFLSGDSVRLWLEPVWEIRGRRQIPRLWNNCARLHASTTAYWLLAIAHTHCASNCGKVQAWKWLHLARAFLQQHWSDPRHLGKTWLTRQLDLILLGRPQLL